jgi:hypothetical protein
LTNSSPSGYTSKKIPATASVAGIFALFHSALNRFDIKVEKCGG